MGYIKNINNVYIPKCGCATWYEHWTKATDQWLICCAELSCTKPISQGAIVQDAEKDDDKWYVVPLCRKHANSNDTLDIGDVHLVSVETASVVPPTKEKND